MKTQSNLFDLIHSLSKSEKRFFKLQTSYSNKKEASNYILLFDAIDKMNIYDEAKLRKKLKMHYFATDLAKTKYLLYNLILKTLNHLRYNNSCTQKLSNDLRSIELLYQKTLYKQCLILTRKAQKKAASYELNDLLLAFVNWEIKLLPYMANSKTVELVQQLLHKSEAIHLILKKENILKNLLAHTQLYYNNSSHEFPNPNPNPPMPLKQHTNLLISEEHSFLSLIYTHEILAIQAQYHSRFKKAIAAYEEILILWKSHPEKVQIFREAYLRTIAGYIHCSLNNQNNINYDALLDELKAFPTKSLQEQNKLDLFINSLEFIIQVSKNNLEMSTMIWMSLSELMTKHQNILQADWLITTQYHICIFHFLKEDYHETRYWVEQINSSPLIKHSPQIQNYCKLIDLISLYELQEYDALEYDIRKTYRYLREKRQIREIERAVLNCVQKLLNATHIHEQAKIFTHLHQSLQFLEQKNIFQLVGPNVIFQWVIDKLPQNDKNILN